MDDELSFYTNEHGQPFARKHNDIFYRCLQSVFDVHAFYANEHAHAYGDGRSIRSMDYNGNVSLHAKPYAHGNDDQP